MTDAAPVALQFAGCSVRLRYRRLVRLLFLGASRSIAVLLKSAVAIVLAFAAVLSLTGCVPRWSPAPVSKQVSLPAVWTASRGSYQDAPPDYSELPTVRLNADGTAEVENLPLGKLGKRESHECFVPTGKTYSGPATWASTDGGLLRITHKRTAVFWAGTGYMGSLDWYNIRFAECGSDSMVGFSTDQFR